MHPPSAHADLEIDQAIFEAIYSWPWFLCLSLQSYLLSSNGSPTSLLNPSSPANGNLLSYPSTPHTHRAIRKLVPPSIIHIAYPIHEATCKSSGAAEAFVVQNTAPWGYVFFGALYPEHVLQAQETSHQFNTELFQQLARQNHTAHSAQ